MGTRYVAVRTRDGTETLIPNEILISNPVTNWSFSNTTVRRRIPVGVAYDSDVKLALQLCLDAAKDTPRVLDDPKPSCNLVGFWESSVNLELSRFIHEGGWVSGFRVGSPGVAGCG